MNHARLPILCRPLYLLLAEQGSVGHLFFATIPCGHFDGPPNFGPFVVLSVRPDASPFDADVVGAWWKHH